MSGTEWLVMIGGAGAIAWVNWYFFIAQSPSRQAPAEQKISSADRASANRDAPRAE